MKEPKLTLEEHIYHEIKKAIFQRKIGPKTVLSEEQLAEAFHVSRTPVRHVLKRMHYEKIVVIRPKKRVYLHEPTVEEMEEVFWVKATLEKEALKIVSERITEKQLTQLEEMTRREEQFYREGSYYEALMTANNFHSELIEITENELLCTYYRELTDKSNLYLAYYDQVPKYPPGPEEHRQILEALRSRDHTRIEKEITFHWKRVKEYMVYQDDLKKEVDLQSIFEPIKKN